MLNMNGLWPQMAANGTEVDAADVWGLGGVIETQARLWNHMLDANRSVWELYMPWLSAGPSVWMALFAPFQQAVGSAPVEEPVTGDGMAEAVEMQARSWNEFIDANRTFWGAFGWPALLGNGSVDNGAALNGTTHERDGKRAAPPRRTPATRRPSSARAGRADS